jgi:hypothetical protein
MKGQVIPAFNWWAVYRHGKGFSLSPLVGWVILGFSGKGLRATTNGGIARADDGGDYSTFAGYAYGRDYAETEMDARDKYGPGPVFYVENDDELS